jgi:cytochrome b6-f complex iron-sulfur subunit
LPWQTAEERFIDPCHGSHYTYTGEYVSGPSWRSLDQFAVMTNERGDVIVDIGKPGARKRVW